MKKFVTVLLAACMMVVGLAGCGASEPKEPDHTLTFKEGKMVTMNDTDYVGIFFDYTNNSGETAIPCDAINVKAFQNGKELTVIVYTGQKTEGAIQCDTSVQTGTTATVVWTFEPQDDSTVSVECEDGQKFEFEIR